jgi:hypothetical protein
MKEIHTKKGVFLTSYTPKELDDKINEFNIWQNQKGCEDFLSQVRSFNDKTDCCIERSEASELVGIEVAKNNKNLVELYTNYKGNPLGLSINEARLYYNDPVKSLMSAFDVAVLGFDFQRDFFHIRREV